MKHVYLKVKLLFLVLVIVLCGVILFACQNDPPQSFTVTYTSSEGGTVTGALTQSIKKGTNGTTVTALADDDYFFLKWSDGNTDPIRQETNVQSDKTITAIFASQYYSVNYVAETGGTITGVLNQTIAYGQNATTVTAVPNTASGYKFVKWSDTNNTNPIRTDTNIKATINATALFQKQTFTVKYTAGTGGTITGNANQTVQYGENANTITAVPNMDYRFVKWSDNNSTNPVRIDNNIKSNITANAVFAKNKITLNYNYRNATGNNTVSNVILQYETLSQTKLIVPVRDSFTFDGWYLDEIYSIQVSDISGNVIMDAEIFDTTSTALYAKWTVNEALTFKILMVFVTEVHAVLEAYNGQIVEVDYIMSPIERQICELLPPLIEKTLNEMFDGLVVFEVDTFFTTTALGAEHFTHGSTTDLSGTKVFDVYSIEPYDIPEINSIYNQYRTVINTYCMNDYEGLLHAAAGHGGAGTAVIHMESLFGGLVINRDPLENLLTPAYQGWWTFFAGLYLHEFSHTVEIGYGFFEYHGVLAYYTGYKELDVIKLYLLNQAIVDGKKVGISHEFWKGELSARFYTDKYDPDPYTITVNYGDSLLDILTSLDYVPEREGYIFTGWFVDIDAVNLPVTSDKIIKLPFKLFAGWEKK